METSLVVLSLLTGMCQLLISNTMDRNRALMNALL